MDNSPGLELMLMEKGNPCISMVLSTPRLGRDRMQNPELIQKAIQQAKSLLTNETWPADKVNLLKSRLDSILNKIDYLRLQEGLGIYISPGIFKIYLLPFPVKEKIFVGDHFALRDILYFNQFLGPYFLLAISKKKTRLFKGCGNDLQEIVNGDFPNKYVEEYEYAYPSIGSSSGTGLKAFERDKSVLRETRMRSFFMQTDQTLNRYLKSDSLLLLAGVEEETVNFEKISGHSKKLVGRIPGNYDVDAVHLLADIAWETIQKIIKKEHDQLLIEVNENIGKHLAVQGIENVWKAAKEGKGRTLLLEKDYQVTAYCSAADESQLFLKPSMETYRLLKDVVDNVIEIVQEKGGDVVIVENDALKNWQRAVLLLRYPF